MAELCNNTKLFLQIAISRRKVKKGLELVGNFQAVTRSILGVERADRIGCRWAKNWSEIKLLIGLSHGGC